MHAIEESNVKCVELLIDQGADVNHKCGLGVTPLLAAILNSDLDCVNLLIEHGADVNLAGSIDRLTPLMNAVLVNNEEIVLSLIKSGANLDVKCHVAGSPAMSAFNHGHLECARILIEHGVSVNERNNKGESLLSVAAQCGSIEGMKLLLEYKASIDVLDDAGKTPLMYAVAQNHVDCVKFLIEAGARLDITDKSGNDALLVSLLHHSDDICALILIRAGCSLDNVNREGYTAFFLAVRQKRMVIVEEFIERGVNVNQCVNNHTAIWYAAEVSFEDGMKRLIEAGADPNVGYSPLVIAAIRRRVNCIRHLIEAGADINGVDSNYTSMVEMGAHIGSYEIVKIGIDSGASVRSFRVVNIPYFPIVYDEEALLLLFAAGKECEYFNCTKAPQMIAESERDLSLQNLCRRKIRKHMAVTRPTENMFKVAPLMPLPDLMKKYLVYNFSL